MLDSTHTTVRLELDLTRDVTQLMRARIRDHLRPTLCETATDAIADQGVEGWETAHADARCQSLLVSSTTATRVTGAV